VSVAVCVSVAVGTEMATTCVTNVTLASCLHACRRTSGPDALRRSHRHGPGLAGRLASDGRHSGAGRTKGGDVANDHETVTRSSRSPGQLQTRLQEWLGSQMPDRNPVVHGVRSPDANGMSSETLLVDAEWDHDGDRRPHALVARVAPDTSDIPVFPTYDLTRQYRAMQLVGQHTDVPVPRVRWLEEDPEVLGGEFFVMDRVDGRVPPDVMPYTMEGWLLDASPDDRRRLQDASVVALAGIHRIPAELANRHLGTPDDTAAGWAGTPPGPAQSPLRQHLAWWSSYYEWMRQDRRLPLVEEAFAWLDTHWPSNEGPAVLSWGDARIGNIIYDGFTPVATLDWEMVGTAPAGVDVGWMIFLHTFFQDIAEQFELHGLPDMFQSDDVLATYAAAGGTPPDDLHFHVVYAALRHALVMARVHDRRVHFGDAAAVDDPDDAIMHKARLAQLVATRPDR